jgi:hypothetical protein
MCDAAPPDDVVALELLELELPPQLAAATVTATAANAKPARLKNLCM